MKGNLKVLMVFPEIYPFARTCNVGDVGGGLPKALKDLGHDVRVITPQYRITNERKYVLRDVIRLQNIEVPMGKKTLRIHVKSAFIPHSKVQVYFIHYKPYFFREGIYTNPKDGKDYTDNDKRFVLFSKGVLETLAKLQWQPDVIHCHDWQSGLIPFLLKTVHHDNPFFSKTRSLLTVHNFDRQGIFTPECIDVLNLDGSTDAPVRAISRGKECSFLKAGLVYADALSTVSPHYAQEVQSSEFGMLDVLKNRKDTLHGIVHGIDTNIWDPERDSLLPSNYSSSEMAGKTENKRLLLESVGLPVDEDRPLLALCDSSREEKALKMVGEELDRIMALGVLLVIMAGGGSGSLKAFEKKAKQFKDRLVVRPRGDEKMEHMLLAGADMIVLPARMEPCEVTQLCSLRYGTIPIALESGGMADTVQPFSKETGKGTGFLFKETRGKAFMKSLKQALSLYRDKKSWVRIVRNAIRTDVSWESSARKYVKLYGKTIGKKR
jgi:starch synthase